MSPKIIAQPIDIIADIGSAKSHAVKLASQWWLWQESFAEQFIEWFTLAFSAWADDEQHSLLY